MLQLSFSPHGIASLASRLDVNQVDSCVPEDMAVRVGALSMLGDAANDIVGDPHI